MIFLVGGRFFRSSRQPGRHDDSRIEFMRAEQQLIAWLKKIDDRKARLDEHAIVVITAAREKITHVNNQFSVIFKSLRKELPGRDHCLRRSINSLSVHQPL